jgi:hypothetical protein
MAQACSASLKAFSVGNSWRRCKGGISLSRSGAEGERRDRGDDRGIEGCIRGRVLGDEVGLCDVARQKAATPLAADWD